MVRSISRVHTLSTIISCLPLNIEIFIQGNDDCTAFQFKKAPANPGTCTMYTYAELPYHPGAVSSSDSDSDTVPFICGLCAKGPQVKKVWKTDRLYCFPNGIVTYVEFKS